MLVNNGYQNNETTNAARTVIDEWYAPPNTNSKNAEHTKLFYKNHMSSQCEADERAVKDLIKKNVKPANPSSTIQLTIYDQSRKTPQPPT